MWVLQRISQGGGYVAKPGHTKSYTSRIQYAQKYLTEEEARADSCIENERPVRIEYVIN